jgi:extradiol dioxygenase family protein
MTMNNALFHLALPVDDLAQAAAFYGGVLGCARGRESAHWIDFDFAGHQLVTHLVPPESMPAVSTNPVDGEAVPASHFGLVLPWEDWDRLCARLAEHNVDFAIAPTTRFEGRRGEQRTCFVRDPAGNYLEFKCFRHPEMLFATDGLDYP